METDTEEDGPREHHYQFAHVVLPTILFGDTERFMRALFEGDPAEFLERLWDKVGARSDEPLETPDGGRALSVQFRSIHGRTAILIGLPKPIQVAEAWFIAIVAEAPEIPDPWRYFVLERTHPVNGEARAVLCEWFADESRENHRQHMTPSMPAMVESIERLLSLEARRLQAGMRSHVGQNWTPGVSEPPAFNPGLFRFPLCSFAFHQLPDGIAEGPERFASAVRSGDSQRIVRGLWKQVAGTPEGAPRSEYVLNETGEFWVLRMPEPLAPPEPYLMGMPLTLREVPARRFAIYALELASEDLTAPPALCSIHADRHEVIGEMPLQAASDFPGVMAASATGRLPKLEVPRFTLQHLLFYAEIAKAKARES